jgi:preprotein translocase subunit SecE
LRNALEPFWPLMRDQRGFNITKKETTEQKMKKLIEFLKEVWRELKNVTWPGRKEIIASTVVVVLVTVLLMIYLGVIDFSLAKLVKIIFG